MFDTEFLDKFVGYMYTNENWECVLRDDAPQEAKDAYEEMLRLEKEAWEERGARI
jgi:hypothetical protein